MPVLARLENVTRRFGDVTALDDVSLEIGPGRIVGLLGPNGAGKSTLLSLLQGLRRPTSGRVELLGGDPSDYRSRRLLGSTPQETALPPTLRVGEVIDYVGAHFENPVPRGELAEEFGFSELLRRQTGSLSGGQKRRVSVALAFVARPRLVLLDEPTTGLDVDARRTLWEAVKRQHAAGATVVVTSHYLEEIEALAERVIVIGEGRVLVDDDLSGVLEQVGLRMLRLSTPNPQAVASLAGVVESRAEGDGSHTFFVRDADAAVVELVRSGIAFSGLSVRGATLEEAFLTLTSAAPGPSGTTTSTEEQRS
jgi:ABC-2 type transport system ATP-binding protein